MGYLSGLYSIRPLQKFFLLVVRPRTGSRTWAAVVDHRRFSCLPFGKTRRRHGIVAQGCREESSAWHQRFEGSLKSGFCEFLAA